jgi:hypothetical protein
VPFAGRWNEVLNSDADTYAGSNYGNGGGVFTGMNRTMGGGIAVVEFAAPGCVDFATRAALTAAYALYSVVRGTGRVPQWHFVAAVESGGFHDWPWA